ncbi:MAG TPA: (deoxy)nucleoside triphosphate pyrophosphohydrolase [Chitinispirillaceae bacterium]|nr:(deoxy)nucleoside triphosphate pyrophosphohydrolase [Chitinispirillaceae bacterium]
MNQNNRVPVVCAIIVQDNRFLAAQRNQNQSNAELWEFPGGKVKDGEKPEDALRREIREELGATIDIKKQLSPVVYDYPWISIELIPFICSIKTGIILPIEHSQVRFITASESRNLDWAPADIPVLREYLEYKKGNK